MGSDRTHAATLNQRLSANHGLNMGLLAVRLTFNQMKVVNYQCFMRQSGKCVTDRLSVDEMTGRSRITRGDTRFHLATDHGRLRMHPVTSLGLAYRLSAGHLPASDSPSVQVPGPDFSPVSLLSAFGCPNSEMCPDRPIYKYTHDVVTGCSMSHVTLTRPSETRVTRVNRSHPILRVTGLPMSESQEFQLESQTARPTDKIHDAS